MGLYNAVVCGRRMVLYCMNRFYRMVFIPFSNDSINLSYSVMQVFFLIRALGAV